MLFEGRNAKAPGCCKTDNEITGCRGMTSHRRILGRIQPVAGRNEECALCGIADTGWEPMEMMMVYLPAFVSGQVK